MRNSICLGDMGIGFPKTKWPSSWDSNHKFLLGNHDNPIVGASHPNCLGRHGYIEKENIYFISGADSIDRSQRIIGINWFENEQLSNQELESACNNIINLKPKIIVSHDCPHFLIKTVLNKNYANSRTRYWLDIIFEKHRPEWWIFGHHHCSKQIEINNTKFVCLQELESCEVKT